MLSHVVLARNGSKAEVTARHDEVCFTLETGHRLKFMSTRPNLLKATKREQTQLARSLQNAISASDR
jgi:hypothetical protein